MLENISKLNLVRIGSYITYSSLKKIGDDLLESFSGWFVSEAISLTAA
jgi:hypothetical protein